MTDGQVKQIVDAIRAHARAMVAERLWAQAEAGTDVNHVVADADALLTALSASSGPSREWLARMGDAEAGCPVTAAGLAADVGLVSESSASSGGYGQSESQVANATPGREPGQGSKEAATPPLSAEAARDAYGLDEHETVTVRRDDLEWALDWIDPDDHDVCQRRQRLMDVLR